MNNTIKTPIRNGFLATLALLGIYVIIVSLVSGWDFAQVQFFKFWYFIITLAVGFGTQVGLYTYLKNAVKQNSSSRVLAVSGTTSTVAMISCCAHYLVNILPILGAVGIITVISQYQVQLFWVGLAFNFAGIAYMAKKSINFQKAYDPSRLRLNSAEVQAQGHGEQFDCPELTVEGYYRTMKNKLTLLLALVISLGIITFVSLKLPNQTKTQTQQKNNNSVSYQKQTNEKGSVVVEAVPLSLSVKDNASFTVSLTTHSGDLNYDIAATSKLTDNKGNTYKALSWTGGKGGHHVSGILTFPPISKETKSVTLTIPQIGNFDRVFSWDLK